ncbi:3-oxoacyl-[acyl-carrier-protein] synthase III C-terminal domain-containing protein, partial [Streptomyces asiaticus]
PVLAALLLGKAAQASERGVELVLAPDSRSRGLVEDGLDEAAVKPADIAHVVPIAIGSVVLDMLLSGSPLGLRADDTSWTYGRHLGHAGPSDVLLALDRAFRSGTLRTGDRVLVVSFGVGFRWTTALLEITRDPVATAPAGRSHTEGGWS